VTVLLIDNYDSFTVTNLAHLFRRARRGGHRDQERRDRRRRGGGALRRLTSSSPTVPDAPRMRVRNAVDRLTPGRGPRSDARRSASAIRRSCRSSAARSAAPGSSCTARRRPSPTTAAAIFAGLPEEFLAGRYTLAGRRRPCPTFFEVLGERRRTADGDGRAASRGCRWTASSSTRESRAHAARPRARPELPRRRRASD